MGGRAGRKRLDRERYPGDQIKRKPAEVQDKASPFALAKRAALADPLATEIAIKKAQEAHRKLGLELTVEEAARAAASTLPANPAAVGDELDPNDPANSSTALGRYYLWSRYREGADRLTQAQYQAGFRYAKLHGVIWSGYRQDLADTDGAADLGLSGIVVPSRNPPAHLGHFVASTPDPVVSLRLSQTPAERKESREKLWARYRGARAALVKAGAAIVIATEELVVEDHDPWWVSPAPSRETDPRKREIAARVRAARVFRERKLLREGLDILVAFFGTGGEAPSARVALTDDLQPPGSRRPTQRREVISLLGVVDIDPAAVQAAVDRITRKGKRHG